MIHGHHPRPFGRGAKVCRSSRSASRRPIIFAWIWATVILCGGLNHTRFVERKLARFCSVRSKCRHANHAATAWIASSQSKSQTSRFVRCSASKSPAAEISLSRDWQGQRQRSRSERCQFFAVRAWPTSSNAQVAEKSSNGAKLIMSYVRTKAVADGSVRR